VRDSKIYELMSALGHKQTLRHVRPMSALPSKADMLSGIAMSALCHKAGVVQAFALLAAHGWHDESVASATALGDLRAIAKLQILRQAQSHFG
jgi:hypothetical protein